MGAVISQATYPPFIFSLIIGVPSLVLYLIEVFVLLKNRSSFRSAFFRLFLLRFVSNFINYFCTYFYMRLGRLGLFIGLMNSMPSFLLGFVFFFNYYTFHADNISTMFILLNRLTLIIFPVEHVKIWKYLLPASILLTYSVPLTCTVQVLTYDLFVRVQNDNLTFTVDIDFKPNRTYIPPAYIAAMSGLLFVVLCGVLNVLIIILYRRNRRNMSHGSVSVSKLAEQKIEYRLTIYALVTFLAQLSMAIYYILIYVASRLFRSEVHFFLSLVNQFSWIHDISTIVLPAWFLLWASSKIKKRVYALVLPRSWVKENSSIFVESKTVSSIKVTNSVQPQNLQ
ncbi:srg family chemoreceptor domain-containing protein [Ditylenchus destructor]|nr:srg family chemoreceptor domain-containing protein [Ditylenchus destructor]